MRPERGRRTSDGSGDIALDLTSWPYSLPLPAQIRKWYLYKGPFPKPGRVHIYIYIQMQYMQHPTLAFSIFALEYAEYCSY